MRKQEAERDAGTKTGPRGETWETKREWELRQRKQITIEYSETSVFDLKAKL